MRFRTLGILVVVLLGLLTLGAYGVVDEPSPMTADLEFTELWASSPPGGLQANHHSPAAVAHNGESYVAVPINSQQGTLCVLSMLNGSGD